MASQIAPSDGQIVNPETQMRLIQEKLFDNAMKGEWKEVQETYQKNAEAHQLQITKSGDTALHIAVSGGQEEIVVELVRLISEKDKKALKIQNERGNTPLHLAASMGNVKMCKSIATVDRSLVGVRNLDRETPLFLAALHGRKGAFVSLHGLSVKEDRPKYCRGKDGHTILHVAIAGDYFELTLFIIQNYGELVNYMDEQGVSPLHLLATKPSVFRSGTQFGRFATIIYHCIFVDELKEKTNDTNFKEETKPKYPENYQTCVNLFRMLRKVVYVGICRNTVNPDEQENTTEQLDVENHNVQTSSGNLYQGDKSTRKAQSHELFPPNYATCFEFIKFVFKAVQVILGFGSTWIRKIRETKENNTWSVEIMNELLSHARGHQYEYEYNGRRPLQSSPAAQEAETDAYTFGSDTFSLPQNNGTNVKGTNGQGGEMQETNSNGPITHLPLLLCPNWAQQEPPKNPNSATELARDEKKILSKKETPILTAAKNGVTEIVEKILQLYPVAIYDLNNEKKNIVLLAVENRQPHVYDLLLNSNIQKDYVFHEVDENGNSALHLAAMLGNYKPWKIPGAALQMQWELKWYEFVKSSMPDHFFVRYNKQNKTPEDIFTETHKDLVQSGSEWLTHTSESCSVVAALVATVAFATSATVPGGVKDSGIPTLEKEPAFRVFSISSLVALCFSITSVVMFLSILTSRYQDKDFGKDLPRKLMFGLSSLFVSIAAILISFCAGHFFMLADEFKYWAFPVYIATCLPATFFLVAQFPLYLDLIWATWKVVPQRSYSSVPL